LGSDFACSYLLGLQGIWQGGPGMRRAVFVALVAACCCAAPALISSGLGVGVASAEEQPGALFRDGYALYKAGKLAEAAQRFERGLAIRPGDAAAHYQLAEVYRELKQPAKALPHYQAVLQLDPDGLYSGDAQKRAAELSAQIAPAPKPGSPQESAALQVELAFWDSMKNSTNPADYQAYLQTYPNGHFAALARTRAAARPATPASAQAASPEQLEAASINLRQYAKANNARLREALTQHLDRKGKIPETSFKVYRVDLIEVTAVNGNQCKVDFGYTLSRFGQLPQGNFAVDPKVYEGRESATVSVTSGGLVFLD
jgi:tetratricopeptide (TPR) repeat protein